jgi:hypothetical protein
MLVTALVAYLTIGYINQFTAENQVNHEIDKAPLYDRGHNFFPLTPQKYANGLIALFLIYFVIRWGFPYPETLTNYLWMVTLLFMVRVIVLTSTQLPPPLPGCSTVSKEDPFHFIIFQKSKECLDLMYSGHTIHTVLVMMFTLCLSPYWIERYTVVFFTLVELCLIISSRLHYTCDVLVATLVTILIFLGWVDIKHIYTHWYHGGLYGRTLKSIK